MKLQDLLSLYGENVQVLENNGLSYDEEDLNDELSEKEILQIEYWINFEHNDVEGVAHLECDENKFKNSKSMVDIFDENDEIKEEFEDDSTDKFYSKVFDCEYVRVWHNYDEKFIEYNEFEPSCSVVKNEEIEQIKKVLGELTKDSVLSIDDNCTRHTALLTIYDGYGYRKSNIVVSEYVGLSHIEEEVKELINEYNKVLEEVEEDDE